RSEGPAPFLFLPSWVRLSAGSADARRRRAAPHARTGCDSRRQGIQLLDGEACRRLVAGHEGRAFAGRNDVVDVVERAAAALVDDIEQSERTGAAVAQHKLRD